MASINIPVMEISNAASISRAHVGLVTLISVKRSPMISRPTKIKPFSFNVGATARAMAQSLSLNGRASHGHLQQGYLGFRLELEFVLNNTERVHHQQLRHVYHHL